MPKSPVRPWRPDSDKIASGKAGAVQSLYEKVYCARGRAENLIKADKLHLACDRTSCTKAAANQFRRLIHTAAASWLLLSWLLLSWLLPSWRGLAPRASFRREARFDTIRLCLISA